MDNKYKTKQKLNALYGKKYSFKKHIKILKEGLKFTEEEIVFAEKLTKHSLLGELEREQITKILSDLISVIDNADIETQIILNNIIRKLTDLYELKVRGL